MDLISAVINRPVVDVVVRNNEPPPEDTSEKAERLDVNCSIDDGSQADLEMQASPIEEDADGEHQNLKGKSVYYLCDLHSSQSSKGVRRYDRLARTYQVTFCSYTVFPYRTEFVNSFSLRHDKDNELLSNAVQIYYIELSKLKGLLKKPVEAMADLEKWAIFFRYANDGNCREKVNEIIKSKEALQMAGELLMSISQDERERAVVRSRRMYQTDLQSNLATAEDRGRRLGRQEGLQEGLQEGRSERNFEIARMMLSAGEPMEKVMSYTGLTRQEITQL